MTPQWIWQEPDWPALTWQSDALAPLLRELNRAQGKLLGKAEAAGAADNGSEVNLDALLQNIITSSAIEGETLNAESVRSSLARRLGLPQPARARGNVRSEGLAELMFDATRHPEQTLTLERLYQWHRWLFPDSTDELNRIRVGELRGNEPMQVVSGRIDQPRIHFEAPPRKGLEGQLKAFLRWFNNSRTDAGLDPLLRAGIAHFWFVTLHPFDDGNGRLARAITDLALAQGDRQSIRLYAMSAAILDQRNSYYEILETTQKGGLDITPWLRWFLQTLQLALEQSLAGIDRVLNKTRFWKMHSEKGLAPEQVKVLNRLLEGGKDNFEHGISASQYQKVAKVSKATATRHLADLLAKGCLEKLPGGGRSTRYQVAMPAKE